MEILETITTDLVVTHRVGNVTIGGEPVYAYVEASTGYAPYDAYPVSANVWLTTSERHLPE